MENNCKYQKSKLTKNTKYTKKNSNSMLVSSFKYDVVNQ